MHSSPRAGCKPGHPAVLSALAAASLLAMAAPQAQAQAQTDTAQTITITATVRKKAELVQDIPATVNVLSGSDLAAAGVTDVRGIEYKIPGLVLGDKGFDGASIGIRGASSLRAYTGDEAAVAVHLDGIYVPQSGAALGRLFDIARVETLFGPQGSLYGRNAVAGVIDIVSNSPGKVFGGGAQISYGSFSTTSAEGVLNVPLNADSGLRFAVSTSKGDGYVKNVLDGRTIGSTDFSAGRARYVGQFGPVKADFTLQSSVDKSLPARQPGRLNDPASLTQGVGFFQTAIDTSSNADRKDNNLAVKFDLALGDLTLRSITGYTTYKLTTKLDSELSRATVPQGTQSRAFQDSKAWSQELSLRSSGDNVIDWSVGAYITGTRVNETRQQDDTTSTFASGFGGYDDFKYKQDGLAKAVFASVDWKPTSAITATVGLRHNVETKEASQDQVWGIETPSGPILDCSATGGGANFCSSADKQKFKWTGNSGDLTLKYALSKQSHVYGRAARGFRSGAIGGVIALENGLDQLFFGPGTFTLPRLNPEVMDSYELGYKTSLLDRTLLLSAAVFHNTYKDMLVFGFDPATFRQVEGNLGESVTKGVDLALAFEPNRTWRFDAAVSYADGKITEVGPTVIGARVGNKPIFAPRLSASVGVNYRMDFAGGKLNVNLEANHKDKLYFDLANVGSQGAVDLLNFNMSWQAPAGWRVFAAVNNVTDKEYLSFGSRTDPAAGGGPLSATPAPPRTYRVGAGFNF